MNKKTKKYTEMNAQELNNSLMLAKSDLFKKKCENALSGENTNISSLRSKRKEIARIMTHLSALKKQKIQRDKLISAGEANK